VSLDRAKLVEDILRGITVPGFDVDIVSCGAVTRFRISRDGKKVAAFVDFTSSDPGCPFCKFVNHTVWSYTVKEIKERLRKAGFEEIYVVDERTQAEL
jgi:metal-sulfur cluster biosynthetic enzyme